VSGLAKAVELFLSGRLEEARRACQRALKLRADLVEAHALLAEIYRRLGDAPRAREAIERVTRLRPDWGEARVHQAVGDLLIEAGRYAEAEERYRRALDLDPALLDARFNLAGALSAQGNGAASIAELQALLEREPRAGDARERLMRLLLDEQRYDELERFCREAMVLHPDSPQYPSRLGTALWRQGREEEGLQAFRVAVERAGDPTGEAYEDAKLQEATALLALGRYAGGWRAYRWRHPRTRLRRAHPELLEDPAAVAAVEAPRRIRIVSEQGLGDELFFLRFAVALRARGHRLSVDCEPKLAGVLAALPQLLEGVNSPGEPDITLCSGDLPLASGLDIAPPLPLAVDAGRRASIAARLHQFGPPPYVGVTWRSGYLPDEAKPERGSYLMKHLPADLMGRALRPIDARVVLLQRRPSIEDVRMFERGLGRGVLDLSAVNDELPDALALLSLLDEYIGVSNTNMHLRAGLPGKPARVLVRTPTEWRWAGTGAASVWFPGFEIYRQSKDHDWPFVLERLGRDLGAVYGALHQK